MFGRDGAILRTKFTSLGAGHLQAGQVDYTFRKFRKALIFNKIGSRSGK